MIAVLDTGGVGALAPSDATSRARLRALRQQVDGLVIPAAVLAEGVRSGHPGRDHHVRRLLQLVTVADLGEQLGHDAGALRSAVIADGASPPPSGVDATVAATAVARAATGQVVVVTGDVDDLHRLLEHGRHAARVSLLRV